MFFNKKDKVFCIGAGKTGTTSVGKAFKDLGYKLGHQPTGELLIHDYGKRNFKKIIDFCKSADAFQDAPFCFKYTFIHLDAAFPNSKFILTERDNPDQWYSSMVNFHATVHANTGNIPTIADLKSSPYRYPGYAWDVRQIVYGINENQNPFDKELLIKYYTDHNNAIKDYFRYKNNLLVLNLSDKSSYKRMCDFLCCDPLYDEFPWENKSVRSK